MTIGYAPNGSNYHDHLCTCPGCVPGDPDPTDEEILEMAWRDLQAVPSYVERYTQDTRCVPVIVVDFVIHDEAHPFCDDMKCPCHSGATWDDIFYYNEHLEQPFDDGLLTVAEKHRLWEGRQV